jgi:glycosyltransferase involved in cell wall biosynthesis
MVHPSVAAIVPVYNRSKVVIEALESVAAQTLAPTRLIVVDDGSADGTADRVEEWIAKARPRFDARLIHQSNQGAAVARNRGAAEASDCELLAFLDSDDLWPEDYLQRTVAALGANPDAVAAACDRVNFDFATNRSNPHSYAQYESGKRNIATIIFMDGPPGTPNTVFRASAFRRLGGYDPQWPTGQDYDLMLRLSLLGRWLYVPGAPVTSRNHTELVKGGGEPPLSRKYPDRVFRRVQMLDRFIHQAGGAAVVPERCWRGRLSQLWFRAGRRLLAMDRAAEAGQCFRRTVELRPWHLPARWRLWATRGD